MQDPLTLDERSPGAHITISEILVCDKHKMNVWPPNNTLHARWIGNWCNELTERSVPKHPGPSKTGPQVHVQLRWVCWSKHPASSGCMQLQERPLSSNWCESKLSSWKRCSNPFALQHSLANRGMVSKEPSSHASASGQSSWKQANSQDDQPSFFLHLQRPKSLSSPGPAGWFEASIIQIDDDTRCLQISATLFW